jgi:hypothetical protein
MTLSAVKNLIMTSLNLDTIRQKRDQDPKQQRKKHIQKSMQKQSTGIGRSTRKITRRLLHREDSDFRITNRHIGLRKKRPQNQQPTETYRCEEEEGFIRLTPLGRSSTPRYQTIFLVLCYACNNFGHTTVNYRDNNRNIKNFEIHTKKGYPRRPSETQRRSYNRFESLNTEVECYKCNKFGHMAKDCRMAVPPREMQ